jgi:hypothetical protein
VLTRARAEGRPWKSEVGLVCSADKSVCKKGGAREDAECTWMRALSVSIGCVQIVAVPVARPPRQSCCQSGCETGRAAGRTAEEGGGDVIRVTTVWHVSVRNEGRIGAFC